MYKIRIGRNVWQKIFESVVPEVHRAKVDLVPVNELFIYKITISQRLKIITLLNNWFTN